MSYQQTTKELRKLVREACRQPANTFGRDIWEYHIKIVIKIAKELAAKSNSDVKVVEIASILHDYASVLDSEKYYENHEEYGAQFAQELLSKYGYDQPFINQVKQCILNHRGSRPRSKMTMEEICVADADAMAHFYGIASLFTLCIKIRGMNPGESEKWIWAKLNRSYFKLSQFSKELISSRYHAAKLILNQ